MSQPLKKTWLIYVFASSSRNIVISFKIVRRPSNLVLEQSSSSTSLISSGLSSRSSPGSSPVLSKKPSKLALLAWLESSIFKEDHLFPLLIIWIVVAPQLTIGKSLRRFKMSSTSDIQSIEELEKVRAGLKPVARPDQSTKIDVQKTDVPTEKGAVLAKTKLFEKKIEEMQNGHLSKEQIEKLRIEKEKEKRKQAFKKLVAKFEQ
ncbi:hypothetical protein B9Z55_026684 [Caenorhabditis nigoni]|uniref:Uncharacterized protein n=1 Tax=Caenorhabditis nigoni TaxID=1611254 RepID=A0A2G5T3T9_9PELO|nr:hypothetical protein B9Z55_026684 [Caenorhabditis nigoni]